MNVGTARRFVLVLALAVTSEATTVVGVRSEDRIVLATDSRIQVLTGHTRAVASGCKLHVTRDIVWAQAGYLSNARTGFDVASIGARVFAGGGTLDVRLGELARAITVPLHRALLSMHAGNLEEYNATVSVPLTIVAAGMDDGTPVLTFLQFERADSGLLETKLYRCPGDCSAGSRGVQYVLAGMHQEASRLIDETPGYFLKFEWREGLRGLLDAEAVEHPDKVGPPYSMVETNRSGIQWLDRGACAD